MPWWLCWLWFLWWLRSLISHEMSNDMKCQMTWNVKWQFLTTIFLWQFLMTISYDNFWWQFVMTISDDNFWLQFLITISDDNLWWQFLMTISDGNFWWHDDMTHDMMIHDTWYMIHDDKIYCWTLLIFMLMLMLYLWLQAETPGVTHFGAYHRPPDGHF